MLKVPHKILNNISLVYNGQARENAYVFVRILNQEPTVDLKQFTEAFQRKTEATWYATFRTVSTAPDITWVSATDGKSNESIDVIKAYESKISRYNRRSFDDDFTNCEFGY